MGKKEFEENLKNSSYYNYLQKKLGDLERVLIDNGSNLSGGQRQVAAIARAVASGRKLLVLDESFSAMDENTFFEIAEELNKISDLTYLCVTHRMEQLSAYQVIYHMDEINSCAGGTVYD